MLGLGENEMRMLAVLLLVAVVTTGCRTVESKSHTTGGLVSALQSKHRNATHIALWTLDSNKIPVPKLDLAKPYSQVEPALKKLVARLQTMSEPKLRELDESFKYHRSIYSPFWSSGGDGWEY
jgi:uncharacterized protein YceK